MNVELNIKSTKINELQTYKEASKSQLFALGMNKNVYENLSKNQAKDLENNAGTIIN